MKKKSAAHKNVNRSELRHTHATIPTLGVGVVSYNSGIAFLKVLSCRWLDCHLILGLEAGS